MSKLRSHVLKSKSSVLTAVALVVLLVVLGIYYVLATRASGTGTLYLTPASSSVATGSTFTVTVYENSGSVSVNAVKAVVSYPASKISLVSIDSNSSGFEVQAAQSGGAGVIRLDRGTTTPKTGVQQVANLTFRMDINKGSAAISFDPTSVLLGSGDNSNILGTTTGGTYSVKKGRK